jgi:ribosomal protein S12 methylthiotransferase
MTTPAVALVTFGCAKNLVDSEVMLGYLAGSGYRFVPETTEADIIILNTCGFIGPSRDEAEDAIRDALAHKERRGVRVIVAGCYAERSSTKLRLRYPGVDAWIGVRDYDKIAAIVRGERYRAGVRTFLYGPDTPRILSTPRGWAYIKVSEGCSHECAYCAIPLIKGAYRSRSESSILREAEDLVARGVREIVLISQDTTFFGRDKGRREGLAKLLRRLAEIRGIEWIRFLYGYPEEVSDELLEAMEHPRICRYLDIPFQHADAAIVKRMKRSLAGPRALKLIDKIRRRLPDASIRTSVIVGFPGEGGLEFENLTAFIREARFDHLGVFTYSREEDTAAFTLGDPVPAAVKDRRRKRILEIQSKISAERLKSQVGKTLDVLIEGPFERSDILLAGRTRFQAPEVDGLVLVERPAAWAAFGVRSPDGDRPPLVEVEITHSDVYDLHGRMVGPATVR